MRIPLLPVVGLMLMASCSLVPALAASAVIGAVAGSMNATIGGQSLLPNTTIFSGDRVQVNDGVAVIAVDNNSRVIFGRDSLASFRRDSKAVTVLLSRGSVSMIHPHNGTDVRVQAGQVSVRAAEGFKSVGEVALLDGSVVITAKEGALRVESHGASKDVSKGQTIVISPKTASNPTGAGAGWGGGDTTLEVIAAGAAGAATALSAIAISRSGSARNESAAAVNAANAAASAANAAAASAAAAYLLAACDYNLQRTGTLTSPITFSGGSSCP
jgi:hypothetical protein